MAELGCGCGAALLGLALRRQETRGLGLDCAAALVDAAGRNACRLGLGNRLSFAVADLADAGALRRLPHPAASGGAAGALDAVLANPPFGIAGRASPQGLRELALRARAPAPELPGSRAGEGPLPLFCRAAALLLRHKGHFFCLWPAADLPALCAALDAAGLGLRRLLPVRPRQGEPARRVLALARRGAAHDLALDAPLTLHRPPRGPAPAWTAAALRFCPWLA